ncbi:MAG: hypothetical protein LC624_12585, partial [Halobacteriales archaeon]|nr:hypothetical protein [Halobacteriales archaeon]
PGVQAALQPVTRGARAPRGPVAGGGGDTMATSFEDGASPGWGLYVDEQRRDLDSRKSIKVKLPIRQHIKLHALKLFSENNISQTVEAALDLYFDRMRSNEAAARVAAQDRAGSSGSSGADSADGSAAPGDVPGGLPSGPGFPAGHRPGQGA